MSPKNAFSVFIRKLLLSGVFVLVVFSYTTPVLAFNPITYLINTYKNYVAPTTIVVPIIPVVKPDLTTTKPVAVEKTTSPPAVVGNNGVSNLAKVNDATILSILERLINQPSIVAKL